MKTSLGKMQLDLLREIVANRKVPLKLRVSHDGSLELPESEKEILIRAVASEFTETGLSSGDEPNKRGLEIENLLDRINSVTHIAK